MFYFAKIVQAAGLTLILMNFVVHFPNLMSPKIFILGIVIFGLGWGLNRFMVKR